MSWPFDFLSTFSFLCLIICFVCPKEIGNLRHHPGHLKPFGLTGPFEPVDEVDGYLTPREFLMNYVALMKPLKMKNASKNSPAFTRWTDSYFLSLESLKNCIVSVEDDKIEDREKPILNMTFHDFLKMYNSSNNYLVTNVPPPLSSDVFLPFSLQCPQIYQELLLVNIMWMSSGGTASVVHTDSVDNIICSLRGSKQIILVDPQKYSEQVMMDHPDQGYSDIDVKRVNYTKYFGLDNVSYHVANVTSGDCLFIPYQWIHQVASFNSNIAVNVWWDHQRVDEIDLDECTPDNDHPITLSEVTFQGIPSYATDFRSELASSFTNDITSVEFYNTFINDREDLPMPQAVLDILDQMFNIFDIDKNGIVTKQELDGVSLKDWMDAESFYDEFQGLMENKSKETTFKTEL